MQLSHDEFRPSIVVNSIFTSDSIWTIELRTTSNHYDPNSMSVPVEDAAIIISKDNGQTPCEVFHVGEGIYKSDDCFPEAF